MTNNERIQEIKREIEQELIEENIRLRKALEEVKAVIDGLPMDDARLWSVYNKLCVTLGETGK